MKHLLHIFCGVLMALTLNACATFNGVKPISPDVGHPAYHIVEVDNLKPTLKWKRAEDTNVKYDLVIHEGPEAKIKFLPGWKTFKPNMVYFRENLSEPEHSVEVALKPSHIYFWSVKTNKKDSEWSYYNYHMLAGIFYYYDPNELFRFKTPNY
ncbi:hypothetical protein [Desulfoluna butyratoxydans]|uniref:hypothetical protein n=1 Tax=Desulfoluna butyratoxydans TaxID=231438 RepID=UPI0015D35914|nr:hypothetical protein [Desulfoluna butyratoxydans]